MVGAEMKRHQQWFAALLAAGVAAGCSSPQMGRIDQNRDIYETWPIETRQAVLDGKVEPGMTTDMVRVAWGKPTEVVTRAGAPNSGDDEIWIYRTGGGEDPAMMNPNGGMGTMGNSGPGLVIGTGRGGTVIAPTGSIGIGGGTGIGLGGGGIGMGGTNGMGTSPFPTAQMPVDEREVVFRNGVVFSADPPPK
jgi:hypothetical protein